MERRRGAFATTLYRSVHWQDLLGLSVVPIVLLSIFLLPYRVRLQLTLRYADPSLLSLFTANYTHLAVQHFLTNLFGYVLVVPTAYGLCVLADRRRFFWGVYTVFVLVFPVILSGLNVELSNTTTRIGLGFSGVLAAFFGFLPIALIWYIRRRFTGDLALQHAPFLFFTGVGVLSLIALPIGDGVYILLALGCLGLLLSSHRLLADLRELSLDALRRAFSPPGYLEFGLFALILFIGFPFVAFPSVSLADGTYTNLFLHLLGYTFGFLVPYFAFAILNPNASSLYSHRTRGES